VLQVQQRRSYSRGSVDTAPDAPVYAEFTISNSACLRASAFAFFASADRAENRR
jgi:hypothetical protein